MGLSPGLSGMAGELLGIGTDFLKHSPGSWEEQRASLQMQMLGLRY